MPVKMERKLRAEAFRKGLTGRRADAYVYGTMRRRKPRVKKRRRR